MTREEWAKCVIVLDAAYQHSFKADQARIRVWYEALRDLPGDRVADAVMHMVRHQAAFPSVAEIRRLAEPAPADPGDAWRQACEYVSKSSIGPATVNGELIEPAKPEPWIMAALEDVGRDAIRHRTTDTENTLRAHFFKIYATHIERQRLAASGLRVIDGGKSLPDAAPIRELLQDVGL